MFNFFKRNENSNNETNEQKQESSTKSFWNFSFEGLKKTISNTTTNLVDNVVACVEEEEEFDDPANPNLVVSIHMNSFADRTVKGANCFYKIDDKFYACMVDADREVNEVKLTKLLNASEIELASEEDVNRITNAKVGFAGPIGLEIPIIMDENIKVKKNFIVSE